MDSKQYRCTAAYKTPLGIFYSTFTADTESEIDTLVNSRVQFWTHPINLVAY